MKQLVNCLYESKDCKHLESYTRASSGDCLLPEYLNDGGGFQLLPRNSLFIWSKNYKGIPHFHSSITFPVKYQDRVLGRETPAC